MVCQGANAAPDPKPRLALVIGNSRYESAVGPLRNTGHDAEAVAKTLRSLGFVVLERHNLTRDQLLRAVLEFRNRLAGAEIGLFYFAGHGISVTGANYLIPIKSGYNPAGADDVTLRLLAETHLFNVDQAIAQMNASGTRCNILILDACRTSLLARTGRTRDVAGPGGLAEMKPPAGSLIAFATDAGQTAQDGEGKNGLYTEELLKNMRTPGLTIEQVFKRTRAGVLKRSDGGQIPAEYSRLVGEDIFLAGSIQVLPAEAVQAPLPSQVPAALPTNPRPLPRPTLKAISRLAAAGKTKECVDGLQQIAHTRGPGNYAAEPLAALLDRIKTDLEGATKPSLKVEADLTACDLILTALHECLPPNDANQSPFRAKALNRRGDALLILGRPAEALPDFDTALTLTPSDAYIVFNRGRAYLALGRPAEARAAFQTASSTDSKQPGAKKLAAKALAATPP